MNSVVKPDRTISISLDSLVGSFRSFGRLGPVYEILKVVEPGTGSNVKLRIRVVESGEELEYALNTALDDPLAP